MSVSDQEIKKLATLSRLDLSEQERGELSEDLNEILSLAEKINEVDTSGVEPTYHALPLNNVMRADEERPSPDPQKVLRHAPDASDGYFVVPRVIEEQ
ncbi:MAG: Asp-tRNA(Asn)/Glu-tRNA(Gln) amidotransferase subunit GatC [bacterium]